MINKPTSKYTTKSTDTIKSFFLNLITEIELAINIEKRSCTNIANTNGKLLKFIDIAGKIEKIAIKTKNKKPKLRRLLFNDEIFIVAEVNFTY